jgi:uncharacterized membrane protein YagU involved in acid resistance
VSRFLRGAIAGVVATAPMSAVMMGAKQFGLMGEMPPEKITAKLLKRTPISPSKEHQDALATALHFGFGSAAGALFGVIAPKRLIARIPMGMTYGAAIWGVSYMGWIPAFGIMPHAARDRRDRQMVMLAGHVVYGTALALLVGRRAGNDEDENT